MVSHGLILITALMTTLLAMPLVTRFAHTLGLVDQPDARKVHTASMPRSGGIAIALGFFVTLLLFWFSDPGVQGVMLGALIIIITGICDDLWQISPKQKFAGEILAAIAFVWWSGASLHTLGDLFGIGMLDLGIFSYVITVVGIVGVINAVNLSDGLDGLAGGLSAMACLFLGFFAYVSQQWNSLFILVALSGSLLGFLYYNAHPARVFMGDTGSLLIGFLLSATAVLMAGTQDQVHTIAPISMALILALPIADTLIVMIRRLTLGVSPFAPDKTHLHHRLLDLGIPHGAVVSILYTVMGVFGLTAVMMRGLPEWLQLIAGAGLVIGVYGSVILMGRLDYSWFNDTSKPAGLKGASALNKVLFFNRLTAWSGRSIPWVTWLIPLLLVVPVGFLSELPAQAEWLLVLSVVGLLALYPLQWTQERVGIMHGLLYWYVFLLLGIFSCYGTVEIRLYLAAISVFIGLWVAVKLVFKPNRQVFLTSGFEVLLIMVSWLLPSLLMKASFLDATTQQHLMIACLESIPFLIAMKIIIRRQHQRNRSLTINLALILVIVIVSSMLSIY